MMSRLPTRAVGRMVLQPIIRRALRQRPSAGQDSEYALNAAQVLAVLNWTPGFAGTTRIPTWVPGGPRTTPCSQGRRTAARYRSTLHSACARARCGAGVRARRAGPRQGPARDRAVSLNDPGGHFGMASAGPCREPAHAARSAGVFVSPAQQRHAPARRAAGRIRRALRHRITGDRAGRVSTGPAGSGRGGRPTRQAVPVHRPAPGASGPRHSAARP